MNAIDTNIWQRSQPRQATLMEIYLSMQRRSK